MSSTTELVQQIVGQFKESAPIDEFVARRVIANLDRISDYREFDRRRSLDLDPAAFVARHEQGLLIRHRLGTADLPSGVDRALIWEAIRLGGDVELADAIWTAGLKLTVGPFAAAAGDSLELLRELQGPWGAPGAKRLS
jgi:hypothetical protein